QDYRHSVFDPRFARDLREGYVNTAPVSRETRKRLDDPIKILAHIQEHEGQAFFSKKHFHDVHQKIGLQVRANQPAVERLAVEDGNYIISSADLGLAERFTNQLARFLAEQAGQIDQVVELGSGIGRNLFILARKLEPGLREKIRFYACEYTDAGRQVCEALQARNTGVQLFTRHFDYYQPDFTFLEKARKVLYFTCHSIEQIPVLNRTVMENILEASDQCFCFHAEPVGWQYDDELLKWRRQVQSDKSKRRQSGVRRGMQKVKRKVYKLDRQVFKRFGIGFMDASRRFDIEIGPGDMGRSNKVSLNAARWSATMDYNTNLIPLLKDLKNEGLIRIDSEQVNFHGDNPFNPSTLVAWHKA
ncbi:MAG: hypothetical protein JRF72_22175, partial [Deltaproteobacteria bacterium]|nr:hypothetical protein [Deltaproteobacteria bacterium]